MYIDILYENEVSHHAHIQRSHHIKYIIVPLAMEMHGAITDTFLKFLKKLASAAAKQSDIPYCIVFSYWERRVSTTLQKLNARVLYLAQCKIAGDQQPGAGFADLFRVINEEQNLHRDQAA
jgi:hypothetical protein